jgi:hypothetical protein
MAAGVAGGRVGVDGAEQSHTVSKGKNILGRPDSVVPWIGKKFP